MDLHASYSDIIKLFISTFNVANMDLHKYIYKCITKFS